MATTSVIGCGVRSCNHIKVCEEYCPMTQDPMNDHFSKERAKEIARRTINGDYDLLLACRDLASMREQLSCIPEDMIDTFIAVASEVDALPIGAERKEWEAGALRVKDIEAENYRERVRGVVTEALHQLLAAIDNDT